MIKYTITFLLFLTSFTLFAADIKDYDIIVDRAGRGHFRNVQEAIDSIKTIKNRNHTIKVFIRDGVYKEKINLTPDIVDVKFRGESADKTIITYDDHANINNMRTFTTYTIRISGCDLLFDNLTFENSALQLGQAVATHIDGDKIVFRNCRFLGNQDTIYSGDDNSRHYFENCYIEGTTDFIFGPATAWFEKCTIYCKANSYITAANTPEDVEFGYIFNECDVKIADGVRKVYLGRPWRPYAMTLFVRCNLAANIHPEGWHNWGKESNEKTARYMEFYNYGEGADVSSRVSWSKLLTASELDKYAIENVFNHADNWNPKLVK